MLRVVLKIQKYLRAREYDVIETDSHRSDFDTQLTFRSHTRSFRFTEISVLPDVLCTVKLVAPIKSLHYILAPGPLVLEYASLLSCTINRKYRLQRKRLCRPPGMNMNRTQITRRTIIRPFLFLYNRPRRPTEGFKPI